MKIRLKHKRIHLSLNMAEIEALIKIADLASANGFSTEETRIEADRLKDWMRRSLCSIKNMQGNE